MYFSRWTCVSCNKNGGCSVFPYAGVTQHKNQSAYRAVRPGFVRSTGFRPCSGQYRYATQTQTQTHASARTHAHTQRHCVLTGVDTWAARGRSTFAGGVLGRTLAVAVGAENWTEAPKLVPCSTGSASPAVRANWSVWWSAQLERSNRTYSGQ